MTGITLTFENALEDVIRLPFSSCWIWMGTVTTHGYGRLYLGNYEFDKAHRLSYKHHVGPIPDGMNVLHDCDVRCCINPYHLHLGTHAENSAEMKARGRVRNKYI